MIRQSFFITLILLTAVPTCFGQFTNDAHVGRKISGNVRSSIVKGYNRTDSTDTLFKHLWMLRQDDYNKKGQLIRTCISSNLRGTDINDKYVDTFIYDKKGNIKDILHHDSNGKPVVKETFVYSKAGRFIIIKRQLYDGDTSRFSEQFRLDASNRIIERHHYGSYTDTSVMAYNGVTYFKYNKQGYQILKSTHNPDGPRRFYTTTTYNNDGNIIEFTDYVANKEKGLFTGRYQYTKYDNHHNWIANFHINSNGKPKGRDERQITYYK